MSYSPPDYHFDPKSIGIMSLNYLEMKIVYSGNHASMAWPANNLAIYFPICLSEKASFAGLWWAVGSTASGNACMGIYDEGGNRLQQTGIVAQSGTGLQLPAMTAFQLPRGRYWLGLVLSTTAGTVRGWSSPTIGTDTAKWFAMAEETLGSTQIPATMTPVATSRNPPIMGLMRV